MTDTTAFLRLHAELALADGCPDESASLLAAANELDSLRQQIRELRTESEDDQQQTKRQAG